MKVYTDNAALMSAAAIGLLTVPLIAWYLLRGKKRQVIHVDVTMTDEELIKQGFAAKRIPSDIDVIVIGSGMGGLSVASTLANEGRRVLLLEQHDVAGGNTHTFEEKGYEFDTGFHYIGGYLDSKKSATRKVFDYLSNESIEFQRLGDTVDVAVVEGEDGSRDEIKFMADHTIFKAYLKERFPNDQNAIDEYFKIVRTVSHVWIPFFGLQLCPTWARGLYRWWNQSKFEYLNKTVLEVVSSLTTNKDLIGILNYSWGDFGDPPSRATFALNAAILNHYKGGAYYAIGGPSVITKKIVRNIEARGGKVLVRAPVSSILINSSGAAYGVEVKGKAIHAKTIISTIGAPQTYNKLITDEHKHLVSKQIEMLNDPEVQSCCSLMSLFIGFKGDTKELDLPTHNVWKYPSWDHDANFAANKADINAPFCALFMSFSSAKDPTYAERYPGKQVGLVVAPSFYDHVKQFKDGRVKHRGEEYETMKEVWKDRLINAFLKEFPKVKRETIEVADVGTAITNDYYLGTHRGAVYGLGHTPARFQSDIMNPRTPVKNLYLSGQDIMTCGIVSALYSGLLTASVIDSSLLAKLGGLMSRSNYDGVQRRLDHKNHDRAGSVELGPLMVLLADIIVSSCLIVSIFIFGLLVDMEAHRRNHHAMFNQQNSPNHSTFPSPSSQWPVVIVTANPPSQYEMGHDYLGGVQVALTSPGSLYFRSMCETGSDAPSLTLKAKSISCRMWQHLEAYLDRQFKVNKVKDKCSASRRNSNLPSSVF